jgi:hypothetical protein
MYHFRDDSSALNTVGLAMLVIATLLAAIQPNPWGFISAVIAFFAFMIIGYVNIARPWCRRFRLKRPVRAHFIIPSLPRQCDYAAPDSEEHHIKEVVLPANNKCIVDLIYKARISFQTRDIYFGFVNLPGNSGVPPRSLEYWNFFIETGRRHHVVPGINTDDYRDTHGFYHAIENKMWSRGGIISFAVKVQTFAPGTFIARTFFAGDERLGAADLLVYIENQPHTLLKCDRWWKHRHKLCRQGITPLSHPVERAEESTNSPDE